MASHAHVEHLNETLLVLKHDQNGKLRDSSHDCGVFLVQ